MSKFSGLFAAALMASPLAAQADTTIVFNNFLGPNDTLYTDVIHPWLNEIDDGLPRRLEPAVADFHAALRELQRDGWLNCLLAHL
jgi:hypothetical protein